MLELARFRQAQPANLLVQVLAAQNIVATVQRDNGHAVVLLQQSEHFDVARQALDEFLANPDAPKYRQMAWQASEPVSLQGAQPALFTGQWWSSLGPVVKVVFVACVLIYAGYWVVGDSLYLALMFPADPTQLATQPWRLLTPALVHFSALHIIFNLLWWLDLGRIIERFQSSTQLMAIAVVTAATSNVAQFYDSGANFGGLSGVVYGLLGYLWLYGKVNPAAGYGLRKEVVILMVGWLFLCMTGLLGPVANTAHVVGLLSGCMLGAGVGAWRKILA